MDDIRIFGDHESPVHVMCTVLLFLLRTLAMGVEHYLVQHLAIATNDKAVRKKFLPCPALPWSCFCSIAGEKLDGEMTVAHVRLVPSLKSWVMVTLEFQLRASKRFCRDAFNHHTGVYWLGVRMDGFDIHARSLSWADV